MGIQPRPIYTNPPSAMLRLMQTQPTHLSPALWLVLADGKGPQGRIKPASYLGASALFRLQYPITIFITLRTPGDSTSLIFSLSSFCFPTKAVPEKKYSTSLRAWKYGQDGDRHVFWWPIPSEAIWTTVSTPHKTNRLHSVSGRGTSCGHHCGGAPRHPIKCLLGYKDTDRPDCRAAGYHHPKERILRHLVVIPSIIIWFWYVVVILGLSGPILGRFFWDECQVKKIFFKEHFIDRRVSYVIFRNESGLLDFSHKFHKPEINIYKMNDFQTSRKSLRLNL